MAYNMIHNDEQLVAVANARINSPGAVLRLDCLGGRIARHQPLQGWNAVNEWDEGHAINSILTCESEGAADLPGGTINVRKIIAKGHVIRRERASGDTRKEHPTPERQV